MFQLYPAMSRRRGMSQQIKATLPPVQVSTQRQEETIHACISICPFPYQVDSDNFQSVPKLEADSASVRFVLIYLNFFTGYYGLVSPVNFSNKPVTFPPLRKGKNHGYRSKLKNASAWKNKIKIRRR
jgi:hypothetical protein